MGNKLEVNQDKEEDEVVIKDFDDVFDYIGGWGPFQVTNCVAINTLSLKRILDVSCLERHKLCNPNNAKNFPFLVPTDSRILPIQHLPRLCLPLSHTHLVHTSTLVKTQKLLLSHFL